MGLKLDHDSSWILPDQLLINKISKLNLISIKSSSIIVSGSYQFRTYNSSAISKSKDESYLTQMMIPEILTKQQFGIPVTISIAIMIWLFTTTFSVCWESNSVSDQLQSNTSGCKSDSLIMWTIKHGNWPLQYLPFTAYWDVYNDPILWLTSESYNRLLLTGIAVYGLWVGISLCVKRRYLDFTTKKTTD